MLYTFVSGVYYCFNMVIIMLSIILSSLVVNISRGGSKGVPAWLSRVSVHVGGTKSILARLSWVSVYVGGPKGVHKPPRISSV